MNCAERWAQFVDWLADLNRPQFRLASGANVLPTAEITFRGEQFRACPFCGVALVMTTVDIRTRHPASSAKGLKVWTYAKSTSDFRAWVNGAGDLTLNDRHFLRALRIITVPEPIKP